MSDQIIRKIRALLAKAEATEFEAEAESFFAKAAELMAENAIDEALIRSKGDGRRITVDDVEVRRVIVPNPYSVERISILTTISESLGGYAYYYKQRRDGYKTRNNIRNHDTMAAIVGYPADLDIIVEIFESIIDQCERFRKAAVAAEERMRPNWGLGDKKVYSKSFIRGFAYRIGKRMQEAYEEKMNEVKDHSVALVLVSKNEAIEEKVRSLGISQTKSQRKQDVAGWYEGNAAGAKAQIFKEIK